MPGLTERLSIIIDAQGAKAASEFKKVGDSASHNLGAGERAGGLFSKTLGKLGVDAGAAGAALSVGLAVGAGAVIKFANSSVKAASDLGEQQSATNVIFGKGAAIVQDYAKTTAATLGISRRAALEASNSFGDLFVNLGYTQKQSGVLSTGLVQLAGDLASFKNLGTDVVLEKLRSGLVGETEPLRALGIVINEASVKSKALELGLGGVGRELTEGEKVAARYALIVEKTKNAQGDAARTADSLANKQRRLNAEFEDTQAKVGQALIPIYSAFVSTLEDATGAQDKMNDVSRIGLFSWEKNKSAITQVKDVLFGFKTETQDAGTTQELLNKGLRVGHLAASELARVTADLGKQQELAAKFAEEHTKALDKQAGAMLTQAQANLSYEHSVVSLSQGEDSARDAQKALTDAIKEHGAKSEEARTATLNYQQSQLGLRDNLLAVATAASAAAEKEALAAGKGFDNVASANAQIRALDDLKVRFPELSKLIDNYIADLLKIPGTVYTDLTLRKQGQAYARDSAGHVNKATADGGIFSSAQVRLIGEAGPEAVIPLSPSKRGRALALLAQGGMGWGDGGIAGAGGSWSGGGGTTINLTVNASGAAEGRMAAAAIVDALTAHFRRGGAKPSWAA